MPLYVNTNANSLEVQRQLNSTGDRLQLSFQRLSSGFRINSASDDAAGSAISESMKMQIRGSTIAERNSMNAISMSQTAEGAVGQVTSIIARMRDLAVQAASGELQSTDRSYLNAEFAQLRSEIDRIAQATRFNQRDLLNGSGVTVDFQVGITTNSFDRISIRFGEVSTTFLGLAPTVLTGTDATGPNYAITTIDIALVTLNTRREDFGAAINRLQIGVAHQQAIRTNLSAANSRIADVDVAEETSVLARTQVLMQAGTAVLAQANQQPQLALSLLR